MNEKLESALNKMDMNTCPTAIDISIDLLLKVNIKGLDDLSYFNLSSDEEKAFRDYVDTRINKNSNSFAK